MANMFCFQCEQTAGGKGCAGKAGVCGKKEATALLQDKLTGALINMARVAEKKGNGAHTSRLMMEGLFATVTNVNFDDAIITKLIEKIHVEMTSIFPLSSRCKDFETADLFKGDEDTRSLKSLILFGIRGMAAYAYHAAVLGYEDDGISEFFGKALSALAENNYGIQELLPLVMETGKINLRCMELLDRANTETYGAPQPEKVRLTVEKGPFILVSGHDFHDLKLLLEQTEGKGINVYTHGEMLPAHAYPVFKAYPHLKGNFGTAWQNQQQEFDDIPGAALFTTNCLMPVKKSYGDRVFTTAMTGYPGMVHIDDAKDFSPVIKKAIELGGYASDHPMSGINGGTEVMIGFGHGAILAAAGTIVEAVKSGAIKHFFLVGGCDGATPGRNYYTDFVKQTPRDSIILTLACGKYRFNDLDIGSIGPFPRILDMGQCNDAYSAIKVALALSEAFQCGVNELPFTLILSWYEQKAVSILLTLLFLGIKNIFLGPSLPAFVSPNVLKYLVENFNITPISTPEADLAKILQN
jgi:hydroxylamine reductase